jgi:hypothetical protein
MMKVFDGKPAVEEYMSTHTLTFSTPEITLKKFVIWLSEIVENNGEKVPRITLYLQTRDRENEKQRQSDETTKPINFSELFQNIDETFKPTEAITDRFNKTESSFSKNSEYSTNSDSKFCIECGNKLTADSKFCTKCGARQ